MTYRAQARSEQVTYAAAGVDIKEGGRAVARIKESVRATYRPEVIGDIGGFGGLFNISAAKHMDNPVLVSGTDGVGTKLQVARLLNKYDTVGIDLVAMCVNDILATGAEPLFFLDYIALGKLRSDFVAQVVAGIAQGCQQAGCALIGGEMAEHPGVMDADDFDLSGFAVGIVDAQKMLNPKNVQVGDVLIGLSSTGLHSNGYSLARKVCLEGCPREEMFASRESLGGLSVADALLVPTRIYVHPMLEILRKYPDAVRALAHITGGGITENLNRALNGSVDAVVRLGSWHVPPIVQYVCDQAHLGEEEALKTFNMGIGLVVIVAPERVDDVCAALEQSSCEAQVIGSVQRGEGVVRYEDAGCLFS